MTERKRTRVCFFSKGLNAFRNYKNNIGQIIGTALSKGSYQKTPFHSYHS